MTQTIYPSIAAFYADRGGEKSGESGFGRWWWKGQHTYRVSVVRDTGDIYAIRNRDKQVELLGTIRVGPDAVYETAEGLLAGWQDICGRGDSLDWVKERVQ